VNMSSFCDPSILKMLITSVESNAQPLADELSYYEVIFLRMLIASTSCGISMQYVDGVSSDI
jgi:hypothetical protein